jgi:hypothetical protein
VALLKGGKMRKFVRNVVRGKMIKNIKQIKDENRKAIIRPENFYKGLGQPLTLSRVLLAIGLEYGIGGDQIVKYDPSYKIYKPIQIANQAIDTSFEARSVSLMASVKLNKAKHIPMSTFTLSPVVWDLTKETLEEQSEETQRAINKLLHK